MQNSKIRQFCREILSGVFSCLERMRHLVEAWVEPTYLRLVGQKIIISSNKIMNIAVKMIMQGEEVKPSSRQQQRSTAITESTKEENCKSCLRAICPLSCLAVWEKHFGGFLLVWLESSPRRTFHGSCHPAILQTSRVGKRP